MCTFHYTVPNSVDGLTIATVNHSSVLVQWTPIPLIQVNGVLLGYELIVINSTNVEIYTSTVKSTSAVITGLGKFGCLVIFKFALGVMQMVGKRFS